MKSLYRDRIALLSQTVRLVDFLAILLGGYVAASIANTELLSNSTYLMLILLVALESFIIFPLFHVYRSWRGREVIALFAKVVLAWVCVLSVAAVTLILFNIAQGWRKEIIYYWGPITAGLLIAVRLIVYLALKEVRRRGWNQKRVIIIGAGELGKDLLKRVHSAPWTGYTVVGIYDDNPKLTGTTIENISISTDFSTLSSRILKEKVSEVWIALPLKAEERVREIQHELRHSTVDILYVPDIMSFMLLNHSVSEVVGVPVIELTASPMTGINKLIKLLEDYVLAGLIVVLVSPVMLVIACIIRIDSPGSAIFRQARHGNGGKTIMVYKFRTMQIDVDINQAKRNDPRLTRIGKFLRRTSLDELPQFINVLQGKMSIVGPRPHATEHNDYYKDILNQYMQRHKVKPGITGWAQIHGLRGETDTVEKMKKRLEYDLYYINNWSLLLDMKIFFKSVVWGFVDKNAY